MDIEDIGSSTVSKTGKYDQHVKSSMPFDVRVPSMEILEVGLNTIRIRIRNTDVSFVNSLRRIISSEVPTMAIDAVNIEVNSTVNFDQVLAHRLALIPLKSDRVHEFVPNKDCDCASNCSKCSVKFHLHVKNTTDRVRTITMNDLKKDETKEMCSATPSVTSVSSETSETADVADVEPVDKSIGLVKISKNQELKLEAIAKRGVGKENSKWNPSSVSTFNHVASIFIDRHMESNTTSAQKQSIANECPKKVFAFVSNKPSNDSGDDKQTREEETKKTKHGRLKVVQPDACDFCQACIHKCEEMGLSKFISIAPKKDEFILVVEGTGVLSVQRIVSDAIQQLKSKLQQFSSEINTIKLKKEQDLREQREKTRMVSFY